MPIITNKRIIKILFVLIYFRYIITNAHHIIILQLFSFVILRRKL